MLWSIAATPKKVGFSWNICGFFLISIPNGCDKIRAMDGWDTKNDHFHVRPEKNFLSCRKKSEKFLSLPTLDTRRKEGEIGKNNCIPTTEKKLNSLWTFGLLIRNSSWAKSSFRVQSQSNKNSSSWTRNECCLATFWNRDMLRLLSRTFLRCHWLRYHTSFLFLVAKSQRNDWKCYPFQNTVLSSTVRTGRILVKALCKYIIWLCSMTFSKFFCAFFLPLLQSQKSLSSLNCH